MKAIKNIVMAATVVTMMITSSVFASNGSLTFYHGLEGFNLLGSMESTAKEKSMGVVLNIKYSDGTDETAGGKKLNFNEDYCRATKYARGKKGEFSCKYYCNGSHVNNSSKPWDFNFY